MMFRPTAALLAALACFSVSPAWAETVHGPVHLQGNHGADEREEARNDARDGLDDARQGIADAEQGLADTERDLAAMEAGDFSNTITIEDDKVVKCGDQARYPGCVPYTDAEKAEMVAQMRRDLAQAKADMVQAHKDLEQAERDLASAEQ